MHDGGSTMRRTMTLVGTLLLFGCGNTIPHPTMEADPPLTGIEGIALANQLRRAYEVDTAIPFCTGALPQFQEADSDTYRKYSRRHRTLAQDANCVVFRRDPTPLEVQQHVDAGIALTNLYCDIFFRRLAKHATERRFIRGGVNDVGAAVSAVLGLTHVPSAVTGGVGAGFGLADSSFRNYDESFVVSADLATLQGKVISEQKNYRDRLKTQLPTTYPDANNAILGYANLCSYTGMKGMIDRALTQTTTGGGSTTDTILTYLRQFVERAQSTVAATQGNGTDQALTNVVDQAANSTGTPPN